MKPNKIHLIELLLFIRLSTFVRIIVDEAESSKWVDERPRTIRQSFQNICT